MKTAKIELNEKCNAEKLFVSLKQVNDKIQKDQKWFNSFGINSDKIDYFGVKIKKFETLLYESDTESQWRNKQEQRQNLRVELRKTIRNVQAIMIAAWSEEHPMAYAYKTSALGKLNDFDLTNTGRIILLFAHNYKSELKFFGLRDEVLYSLSLSINKLTILHSEIEVLAKEIKIRKAFIMQQAKELIAEVKVFGSIGRMIWIERDKSHWAEYRLPHHIYRKIIEPDIGLVKK
jgi:hypothetical protein